MAGGAQKSSEIVEIDGAHQRAFVLALQRFEDLIIGVAAEQLFAVGVCGLGLVMRFIVGLQVQHCHLAAGKPVLSPGAGAM